MSHKTSPQTPKVHNRTKYAILFFTVLFLVAGSALLMFVSVDNDSSSKASVLSGDSLIEGPNVDLSLDDADRKQKMASLEIPFIQNVEEIEDPAVLYYADTFAGRVFVTDDSITYVLPNKNNDDDQSYVIKEYVHGKEYSDDGTIIITPFQTVTGIQQSPTNVSSFIGNDPDKWESQIPTYDGISLGSVWPGVDVSLHAYGNNIEKIFTVMPGHDASEIRLSYDGISKVQTDLDGNLALYSIADEDENNGSTIIMSMSSPIAYQEIDGQKIPVDVKYDVIDDTATYGFSVGTYNDLYPLVIDPLIQATYLGGPGNDYAYTILLDSDGNVLVVSDSNSPSFPAAVAENRRNAGTGYDLVISKLNNALTSVLQVTFVGGSGGDEFGAMTLDGSGDVFVTGRTTSYDFPGVSIETGGAKDSEQISPQKGKDKDENLTIKGNQETVVFKLSNDLTELIQSTYLGGTTVTAKNDKGVIVPLDVNIVSGISIDGSGNVFVAGRTNEPDFTGVNTTLKGLTDGIQPKLAADGVTNLFVSKLSNDLADVIQSTYLGTSKGDTNGGIALDSAGNVFVAGRTSTNGFPGITMDSAYSTVKGNTDAIVSKLSNDLTEIIQSTYMGGKSCETVRGIGIDSLDNVFVTGQTSSDNASGDDFPITAGAYQPSFGGQPNPDDCSEDHGDLFVSKLSPDLKTLLASTYLGGSGVEGMASGFVIVFDSLDNVFVGGNTLSDDFPTTAGVIQESYGGNGDIFISKLSSDLTKLVNSTYLGGIGADDEIGGIAIREDTLFTNFDTRSDDFLDTAEGAQESRNNGYDSYLVKLSSWGSYAVALSAQGGECTNCTSPTLGIDSRGIQMVQGGFTFNNKTTDVEYFYTPFDLITVNIGKNNTAEFKIYDDGGPENIRHFEFAYGMDKGQHMSQSNARIEYDIDFQGNSTVTLVDPENAIEDDSVKIETDTVPCKPDATYDCLLLKIHHIFRAPLRFDIVGTNVWDERRNSVQNYYNHGISVEGESLNQPRKVTVPTDTTQNHPAGTGSAIELLQIDVTKDLWIDKWGYVWQGDESRMKLLSGIPFASHSNNDDDVIASESSDRRGSEFSMAIKEQQIVAQILANEMYNFDTSPANYHLGGDNNHFSFADELAYVQHLQMQEELAELKIKYQRLNSEQAARDLLESIYPYISSDRSNNDMLRDSTTVEEDNLLQSLKERILVMDILVNWKEENTLNDIGS